MRKNHLPHVSLLTHVEKRVRCFKVLDVKSAKGQGNRNREQHNTIQWHILVGSIHYTCTVPLLSLLQWTQGSLQVQPCLHSWLSPSPCWTLKPCFLRLMFRARRITFTLLGCSMSPEPSGRRVLSSTPTAEGPTPASPMAGFSSGKGKSEVGLNLLSPVPIGTFFYNSL